MSYSLNDRAAFLRAERDWLTPREEPECTCDRRGCDAVHPDEDTARDCGWTVIHSDDTDIVLCPECTAADAAQDAADLAAGVYSDAANCPCTGCGLPAGAHSDAAMAGCGVLS